VRRRSLWGIAWGGRRKGKNLEEVAGRSDSDVNVLTRFGKIGGSTREQKKGREGSEVEKLARPNSLPRWTTKERDGIRWKKDRVGYSSKHSGEDTLWGRRVLRMN